MTSIESHVQLYTDLAYITLNSRIIGKDIGNCRNNIYIYI